MADPTATPVRSLSLQDLIALNDELAALVRAGVPLERTLGDLGRDLPGRLGRATAQLAERIDRGESLPQALDAMPEAFPTVYRAAVDAGLRSGNLPLALEALSHAARRLGELRRVVALAAVYPLIVILLAYGLFVFLLTTVLPTFSAVLDQHLPQRLRWFIELGQNAWWWWPILPLIVLLLAIGGVTGSRGRSASLRGWPVLGRMLADARLSTFCELLSLLVARRTPLPEAISLAADAVGDAALSRSAAAVAAELRQASPPAAGVSSMPALWTGGPMPSATGKSHGLPPFMLWLIATSYRQETLVSLLEHTAEMYRRRALRRSDWLCYYLPTLLTVVLGGGFTLCFALSLFAPLTDLLMQIADRGLNRSLIGP